jgi:outer membrane protein
MRFYKVLLAVVFCVMMTPRLSAAEGARIASINLGEVFEQYEKTKDADTKLTKEGEKKNKERDQLVQKINKLKDEVQLLSKDAREKKEEELSDKMRELQDFDREARLALQRDRNDMVKDIFKEMDDVIGDYGRKNGYDLIIDERALIYAGDSIDITGDIIELLNKR